MDELTVPSGGDFGRGGEEVSAKSRSASRSVPVAKIMDRQRSETMDM